MEKKIRVKDADAMQTFGRIIGELALTGQVFAMDGELGAGKTTLTQGIARGLHIKERINSPTFNIMQAYTSGRLPLLHMDAYRIETMEAVEDIGLEEYLYSEYVVVMEWASQIEDVVPGEAIHIAITYTEESEEREVTLTYDYIQEVWIEALLTKIEEVRELCIL